MHTPAQLHLPAVPVSQHLPCEGPWVLALGSLEGMARGASSGISCSLHLSAYPWADCDLRDLQDMQEEEGDTGDGIGLELARSQTAKPVSL